MMKQPFKQIPADRFASKPNTALGTRDATLRTIKGSVCSGSDRSGGQLRTQSDCGNTAPQFETVPQRVSLCIRILALGGALGPALFTAVVSACGALRPGYSHITQFISELGATGTTHAALMNFAGFLPSGLFIAGFGIASVWLIPRSGRSILAGGLVTLFGLGIALVGIFHCDSGCSQQGAFAPTIHDRVSIVAFVACIVGIGLWATHFRRTAAFRPLWKYSVVSSIAGLFFLCLLASSIETRYLTGLWQRLMLGTLFLWCMVLGKRLLHQGCRTEPSSQ